MYLETFLVLIIFGHGLCTPRGTRLKVGAALIGFLMGINSHKYHAKMINMMANTFYAIQYDELSITNLTEYRTLFLLPPSLAFCILIVMGICPLNRIRPRRSISLSCQRTHSPSSIPLLTASPSAAQSLAAPRFQESLNRPRAELGCPDLSVRGRLDRTDYLLQFFA